MGTTPAARAAKDHVLSSVGQLPALGSANRANVAGEVLPTEDERVGGVVVGDSPGVEHAGAGRNQREYRTVEARCLQQVDAYTGEHTLVCSFERTALVERSES